MTGWPDGPSEADKVTWAEGRRPTRTYVSKSFTQQIGDDAGEPARYVHKVFDEVPEVIEDDEALERTSHVVYETPAKRKQLELNVVRQSGVVRQIKLQAVTRSSDGKKLKDMLTLNREQSAKLIELVKCLDHIPIEGEASRRIDDDVLRDFFADPEAASRAYHQDPEQFRELIESDASARDVLALQHRKHVVEKMKTWLEDDAVFDAAREDAGGPEKAWQHLLEDNPWILGIGLGGQLLTSWDSDKLEQSVVGRSIGNRAGKRADGVLASNGIIRSLVFAEIKYHRTDLLAPETKPYRSGAWRPSNELSGAVVQSQQTVHLASQAIGDYLQEVSDEGEGLDTGAYVLRPRSFLIVGSLGDLLGSHGNPVDDKVRSFELFRRSIREPEILTFDELLARAEWHVELAEKGQSDDDEVVEEDEAPF